jgi:multidrug efflux pump subunit AcrA (membrane-fusion protein)
MSQVDQKSIESTKQQIRSLVNEIAKLSKSDIPAEQYYAEFLQKIVSALAAIGGAVWTINERGKLELAYQIKLSRTLVDPEAEEAQQHFGLLANVLKTGEPQLAPPQSGTGEPGAPGNPTNTLIVLAPLKSDGGVEGVLEIFQRPNVQPASQRGYLQFVMQMCELAAEWLKSRKLRHLGDRQTLWAQVDQFSRAVHEGIDIRQVSYNIANEGRRLIDCDRLSVALLKGRQCKIQAISGQDNVDDRSNIIMALQRLATTVVATEEPLWYNGSTEDLPPQVEDALEDYIEESHARTVAVLPIRNTNELPSHLKEEEMDDEAAANEIHGEVIGAMIIEQIESNLPQASIGPRMDLVFEHGSRALSNAVEHNNLFLMPVWRAIGKARWIVQARTLPKTVAITAAILALIVAMIVVPTDFRLRANGELQPVMKRDVFTEASGVIEELFVEHGSMVTEGDPIAKIRNTDLEVRYEDVVGRYRSTAEQYNSVIRMMSTATSKEDQTKFSSEKTQIGEQLESLARQQKLLEAQREKLIVRAPTTGEVITWNVEKLLQRRPVQTGQVLLTIADTQGDWELDLYMSEKRMGHLYNALQTELKKANAEGEEGNLEVEYVLASDPSNRHQGKIDPTDIDSVAQIHEEHGHSVKVKVDINNQGLEDPRPGQTAIAYVDAGRRSVGYVWLNEAYAWLQTQVFFRVF